MEPQKHNSISESELLKILYAEFGQLERCPFVTKEEFVETLSVYRVSLPELNQESYQPFIVRFFRGIEEVGYINLQTGEIYVIIEEKNEEGKFVVGSGKFVKK